MREKNQSSKQSNQQNSKQESSNGAKRSGSHAVKRHVRFDRIAVVVIPLLLIIVLITALCLYSCDWSSQEESNTESTISTATTTTVLETEDGTVEMSVGEESSESDVDGEQVTLTSDMVSQGNLIVINADYVYTFSEDDPTLQYVYEQSNGTYSVSDMEIQLDAETLTQLNAMMADFQTETGYSGMEVITGYRSEETQNALYESGSSSFAGGYSDYHSGRTYNLKINFGDGTSDYYDAEKYTDYSWIADHAAEYGFVVRYPEGKEDVTGEDGRGYTFRYVGVAHAMYMTEHDLCLEEYVELLQTYTVDAPLEIQTEESTYCVFYVEADGGRSINVTVPTSDYTISGDNIGGYIVTYVQ